MIFEKVLFEYFIKIFTEQKIFLIGCFFSFKAPFLKNNKKFYFLRYLLPYILFLYTSFTLTNTSNFLKNNRTSTIEDNNLFANLVNFIQDKTKFIDSFSSIFIKDLSFSTFNKILNITKAAQKRETSYCQS